MKRLSRNSSKINLNKEPNIDLRETIRRTIRDLKTYQPIGLIHIVSLSKAIGRVIKIHHPSANVEFLIGTRNSKKAPIDLEFHDGHWTLKNNEDPEVARVALNDCLFEAVAVQVGLSPAELRKQTIIEIQVNELNIAKDVSRIMYLDEWKNALEMMLGGARYAGSSAYDAGRVIDNSQNGTCYPSGLRGHPRGHASHSGASGSTDSVENYSAGGWKTGFLSRADQNYVGHLAFSTDYARNAMDRLNNGSTNEAVHISNRDLGRDDLPMAREYTYGSAFGSPQRFNQVTAVFRHFSGQYKNRDADVFVHTFYPRF